MASDDKTSVWKRWASKIQGKTGEMGWVFAFVLVTCILVIVAGYFTGILPKLWGKTGPILPKFGAGAAAVPAAAP